MRDIRLYIEEPINVGSSLSLEKSKHHYLLKVLRIKEQQKIILFNNSGYNYYGFVNKISSKHFDINIEKEIYEEQQNLPIEIAFSLCKNPCSDLIIQKLTELGIQAIQPLISKNSIFFGRKIDSEKKITHWKNISISACEQSERSYLPEIKRIISFDEYIQNCKTEQKIILNTKANLMLPKIFKANQTSCSLLIGPEGDFTEQEYSLAEQSNFSSASLGDNILRVETAAISAFSFVKIIYNGL